MNTTDPFDLRQKSPLSLLQSRVPSSIPQSAAVTTTSTTSSTVVAGSSDVPTDPMAFSVPNRVPSFQDPQRELEDTAWGKPRDVQQRSGFSSSAVGERIGNYFNEKELPMYKDKPYSYASSRKRTPFWKRKRTFAGGVILLLSLLYLLGAFSSRPRSSGSLKEGPWVSKKGKKSTWDWLKTGEPKGVDWTARRERVKEAFILSWDAYSEHAWGKCVIWRAIMDTVKQILTDQARVR